MSLGLVRYCLSVSKARPNTCSKASPKSIGAQKKQFLRTARHRPFSRSYCSTTPQEESEEVVCEPDLSKEDYGIPDLTLDTRKFYEAFADQKHFQRPEELAWMLWQPPKSILRPDEWLEMRTSLQQSLPQMQARDAFFFFSVNLRTSANFSSGVRDAFLATMDYVNNGDADSVEASMHPTCYHYVRGWLNYMKEQGYTWKHGVDSVLSINKLGATVLTMEGELRSGRGTYLDSPTTSRWIDEETKKGAGLSEIHIMHWVEIISQEKFEVRDRKGSLVVSTPLRKQRHIWKFGTQAKPTEDPSSDDPANWSWRLFDIDNQVILRASDILTKEKLFLDGSAPKNEAWHITKPFGV